ncbi:MAG: carboxylating nicotinate-nucleotide diphosphorylase [Ectothiorhodospiraceae bacterium]
MTPANATIRADVERALAEDVGDGDRTAAIIDADRPGRASVITREPAVICGQPWFDAVYQQLEPAVAITWDIADGTAVPADSRLCTLAGPARSLVTGERTALNFLQLLSGTATSARRYADAVAGTGARILDTRKTIPGLRAAQKYAAACGGCTNHRQGLFDAVLIKENHIMAAGSITEAVTRARELNPGIRVQVEVENADELGEALAAGAESILLDNFPPDQLAAARRRAGPDVFLEASGNVEEAGLQMIAATGVDAISVGAITKHVRAIDLSMRFDQL